jgi:hypothetical protein
MLVTFKISEPKWVKIFAILGVGLSGAPFLSPFFLKISGSATDYDHSIKSYRPIKSQVWRKKRGGVKSATAGILRYVIFEQICVASSFT